ncbi:MAG: hypothetical protein N2C14_14755 [Planctomycetales bacterium]
MKRLGLLLFAIMLLTADKAIAVEDSIRVVVVGTLRADVVAIGGETTGGAITAKGVVWELEFGKNAGFRRAAEKLHGKKVIARGSLERRIGVARRQRWIVTVTDLRAAGDDDGDSIETDLQAAVGRADTRVRFVSEGDQTVIDVASASGIDTATITRKSKKWPSNLVVRLRLSGLESFRVANATTAVEWSVASTGDPAARVSLRKGKVETAINEKNPWHGQVRIVGGNRKIPLKDGFFEVRLPAKLFDGDPKQITLRWIDFYRN